MSKQNDGNFVGGHVAGITPAPTTPAHITKITPVGARALPDVPVKPARLTALDDSMRAVTIDQLPDGAFFMREVTPNTFICYTKRASDPWPQDYQVLIFKRNEVMYGLAKPA